MDLSIIIPSFNTERLLDRCLSSIFTSLEGSSLMYEVIVIDNASEDASIKLLHKKYPRVQIISNKENLGFGKANNQGIKKAKGKFILLLNSDIEALDGAIEGLWRFAKGQKKSFVGGKLLNEDGSPQASAGPMYSLPVVFVMLFCKGDQLGITRWSPRKVKQVDWVSGACVIAPRSAFVDVGLFDEGIFMYMEEIEFLYRAAKRGYTTLFYPAARFIHSGAASSGSRRTPVVNIYTGLLYFYRKHQSRVAYDLLRDMLIVKALAAMLVGRIIRRSDLFQTYEKALAMAQR
ncbi:glycosyltransferase family 2 protein [Candidatus Gottesmanbacteria bacterium]|nr:glycosyltransferase family 2 protein [Candidatus Gottesmanbacteria bacterium]